MLRDIFEGGWIAEEDLKNAIQQIEKFKPTVLVVTKDQFDRYFNSLRVHGDLKLAIGLKKLGINRIIWAEYLPQNEFELTSEESWQKVSDLETITLK